MLRRLALVLGCATAFNVAAQGLFDDNEARRRVERLREEMVANQRDVAEQLKKLNDAMAGASDRSAPCPPSTARSARACCSDR